MTPKHGGLSQLADTADPSHYPVRRRGQKRALNPNWAGIAWLEAKELANTEVMAEPYAEAAGVTYPRAYGWYAAKRAGHYPRPMMQIFNDGATSSSQMIYQNPCPDCDNWARSWNCPRHEDRGLEGFREAASRRVGRDDGRTGLAMPPLLAAGLIRNAEGVEPVAARPGEVVTREMMAAIERGAQRASREHFRQYQEAFLPPPFAPREYDHVQDALRYGLPVYIPAEQARPQVEFTGISGAPDPADPRADGTPGIRDVMRALRPGREWDATADRISNALLPADAGERLNQLEQFSGEFTLQVDGETVEGVQSFTIHIEQAGRDAGGEPPAST